MVQKIVWHLVLKLVIYILRTCGNNNNTCPEVLRSLNFENKIGEKVTLMSLIYSVVIYQF